MATITPFPTKLSDGSILTDTPELLELRSKLHKRFGVTPSEPEYESQLDGTKRANTNAQYSHAVRVASQTAHDIELSGIVPLAAQLDAHMRERIQIGALEALTVLENIVSGALPAPVAIRARYASYLLACAGYGPLTKQIHMNQHLTREDIEAIKQRCSDATS